MATTNLVVVGVDDGPHSVAAFQRALRMFSKDGTQYQLAYARPDETEYQMDEVYGVGFRDYWQDLEDQRKRKSQEVLSRFGALAQQANVKFSTVELQGDAREQLCKHCKTAGADCLVLGSRGAGFIERLLLGSVSSYCTNHAPCAVLVDRCEAQHAGEPISSAGS